MLLAINITLQTCDLTFMAACHLMGRDFGGNMRFSGQATTVKCFENNPLVRKVGLSPDLQHAWVSKLQYIPSSCRRADVNTGDVTDRHWRKMARAGC